MLGVASPILQHFALRVSLSITKHLQRLLCLHLSLPAAGAVQYIPIEFALNLFHFLQKLLCVALFSSAFAFLSSIFAVLVCLIRYPQELFDMTIQHTHLAKHHLQYLDTDFLVVSVVSKMLSCTVGDEEALIK